MLQRPCRQRHQTDRQRGQDAGRNLEAARIEPARRPYARRRVDQRDEQQARRAEALEAFGDEQGGRADGEQPAEVIQQVRESETRRFVPAARRLRAARAARAARAGIARRGPAASAQMRPQRRHRLRRQQTEAARFVEVVARHARDGFIRARRRCVVQSGNSPRGPRRAGAVRQQHAALGPLSLSAAHPHIPAGGAEIAAVLVDHGCVAAFGAGLAGLRHHGGAGCRRGAAGR